SRLIASLHRADLAPGPKREQNFAKFISDIQVSLRLPDPIVLPCALFALNAAQYAGLPRNDLSWETIKRMCQIAGVPAAEVEDLLCRRYGETDLDFAPFEENKPLRTTIYESLLITNSERKDAGRRQVHLLWCQDRLVANPPDDQMRDLWVGSN